VVIHTNNTVALTIGSDRSLTAPAVYSNTVGATNRDLYIDNTGLIGYVSSSARFKDNVIDLTDSERIFGLRPVWFTYKGSSVRKMGVIAEEADLVVPELTYRDNDGVIDGFDYKGLIVPMLAELKKLRDEVKALRG
jgi:hypothetical protein